MSLLWSDLSESQKEMAAAVYKNATLSIGQVYKWFEDEYKISSRSVRRWAEKQNWTREVISTSELFQKQKAKPTITREDYSTGQTNFEYEDEELEEVDMDKAWKLIEDFQKEWAKATRKKSLVNVRINDDKPIGVVFLSDVHIGGLGTNFEQLRKDIDVIANTDGLYVYWGGDSIDNFILGGKMSSASREQIIQPDAQWKFFEYILRKLEGKIIAIGTGNHEAWSEAVSGIDGVKVIADKLNLVYTKHGGMLNLNIGTQRYKIMRRHRFRGESSGHLTAAIKRMYDQGEYTFDVGVLEDLHQPALEAFVRHPGDRNGRPIWAVRPGTYKIDDAYAIEKGYYYGDFGNPTLIFFPDEWRIDAHRSMKAGIDTLNLYRDK